MFLDNAQLIDIELMSSVMIQVYKIFLKWNEDLNSGCLDAKDVVSLRESLAKQEFTVLPTVQDRWVSLHPSFGLVCWVDDKELWKEFKYFMGIDYLHFGERSEDDENILPTRISGLLRDLGIPSLSDVRLSDTVLSPFTFIFVANPQFISY